MHRSLPKLLFVCLTAAVMAAPAPVHAQSRSDDGPAKAAPAPKPQIPAKKKGNEQVPAERRAECAWTGQRIVSLLWRDDVNTAREQARFYEMFGCPAGHLPVAFRCVIEQSENQPDIADLTARVYGCWMAPDARDTPQ
jgi:hypothetical protein